jgi:hypothetical protein
MSDQYKSWFPVSSIVLAEPVMRDQSCFPFSRVIVILLTQPGIILVEPVISGPHFPPLWSAEDAVGVIPILANTVQLYGVHPVLANVLFCDSKNRVNH